MFVSFLGMSFRIYRSVNIVHRQSVSREIWRIDIQLNYLLSFSLLTQGKKALQTNKF